MKLHCPTTEERLEEIKRRKLWFAWHPVRIHGTSECRWLEFVVRSYPDASPLYGMPQFWGDGHLIEKGIPVYEAPENHIEFSRK